MIRQRKKKEKKSRYQKTNTQKIKVMDLSDRGFKNNYVSYVQGIKMQDWEFQQEIETIKRIKWKTTDEKYNNWIWKQIRQFKKEFIK